MFCKYKVKGTTINHLGGVVQIEKKIHSEACRKKTFERVAGKKFVRGNPHHVSQMINGRPLKVVTMHLALQK